MTLHPTGDNGATPHAPPTPHTPITYPHLRGSLANVMAGRAHVEALGLPADRLAALGEYVAGHEVGRILADELIRLDRGPLSFPWPTLRVTVHSSKSDHAPRLVTVATLVGPDDAEPLAVTVHPAMLDELMEAATDRWDAHLAATRTDGDVIAYRRTVEERWRDLVGPMFMATGSAASTIVGRGWN